MDCKGKGFLEMEIKPNENYRVSTDAFDLVFCRIHPKIEFKK
jgi:hypothetical protein